jgi:hypothetical protein
MQKLFCVKSGQTPPNAVVFAFGKPQFDTASALAMVRLPAIVRANFQRL